MGLILATNASGSINGSGIAYAVPGFWGSTAKLVTEVDWSPAGDQEEPLVVVANTPEQVPA